MNTYTLKFKFQNIPFQVTYFNEINEYGMISPEVINLDMLDLDNNKIPFDEYDMEHLFGEGGHEDLLQYMYDTIEEEGNEYYVD